MGLLHNMAELIAKQAGRFSAIRELLTYRHASLENIVVEYEMITVFENKIQYNSNNEWSQKMDPFCR